jgi:hypothetical protein
MHSLRPRTAGLAALCASASAAMLITSTAHAVTFTQVCVPGTVVPLPLDTNGGSFTAEHDLNAAGIANHLNSLPQGLRANSLVDLVDLHFTGFQLETNYDKLYITENFGSGPVDKVFTGNMGAFTVPVKPEYWDGYGVDLTTYTDYSVNSGGFALDQATVQTCRNTSWTSASLLTPARRSGGLLLGAGDVVSFIAQVPPVGKKLNVAVWSDVPGVDFDVYARCNNYATPDVWHYRGYSGDAQEFLSMDTSMCPAGNTWFITVNSYGGKGSFNIASGVSHAAQELTINVTTEQNEPPAVIDAIADSMLKGMRELYGMTEGGFVVNRINVCNKPVNGSCPGTQHFVWKRSCNRSYASGGQVSMCVPNWYDPMIVAHEAGHSLLLLPDEYQDVNGSSQAQCGHTMMSMIAWWENNLCNGNSHKLDPVWGAPAMDPSIQNSWSVITANGKVPTETSKPWAPDNYSYQNFDFNGYIYTSVTY